MPEYAMLTYHVQWNLSWQTTAMRDHLSWKTSYSWQVSISMYLDLSSKITCLEKPHLYGQWGGLSKQVYCIANSNYSRPALKDPSGHKMWSSKRWSLATVSITCTLYIILSEICEFARRMWSCMAVVFQKMIYCTAKWNLVRNSFIVIHAYLYQNVPNIIYWLDMIYAGILFNYTNKATDN